MKGKQKKIFFNIITRLFREGIFETNNWKNKENGAEDCVDYVYV